MVNKAPPSSAEIQKAAQERDAERLKVIKQYLHALPARRQKEVAALALKKHLLRRASQAKRLQSGQF